jgi:hypothetical protein
MAEHVRRSDSRSDESRREPVAFSASPIATTTDHAEPQDAAGIRFSFGANNGHSRIRRMQRPAEAAHAGEPLSELRSGGARVQRTPPGDANGDGDNRPAVPMNRRINPAQQDGARDAAAQLLAADGATAYDDWRAALLSLVNIGSNLLKSIGS